MDNEKKLRKALRPVILAQMAKHPNELQEGFFDNVMDHISGILQKSNDKNYKAKLATVAKSSPEGKAAVNRLAKHMDQLEGDMVSVEELMKQMLNR